MTLPEPDQVTTPPPALQVPPGPPRVPSRREPGTILLLSFHCIAFLGMLGAAAFMVISTLIQMNVSLPGLQAITDPLPGILLACGLAFSSILMIPALVQSIRLFRGLPDPVIPASTLRLGTLFALLAVWILIAVFAQLFGDVRFSWLFLPVLVFAGMGLPIYLLFRIGTGGISLGSTQRAWTVFGLGLVGGPLLAGLLELGAYLVMLLGGGLLLTLRPEWQAIYTKISAQVEQASSTDQILSILSPYLMNPVVIVGLLLVVAIFIPLVEELVKPLGLWLLRKNPPSPQQGFALGVISGAGFALLESLLAASSNDGAWGLGFVARIGGSIMHIFNTGMMGWAIATYWRERRTGRFLRTYGLVVLLHGAWNAITIGTIVGGLRLLASPDEIDLLGSVLIAMSVVSLVALAITVLVLLILYNRRMRPLPAFLPPADAPQPGQST